MKIPNKLYLMFIGGLEVEIQSLKNHLVQFSPLVCTLEAVIFQLLHTTACITYEHQIKFILKLPPLSQLICKNNFKFIVRKLYNFFVTVSMVKVENLRFKYGYWYPSWEFQFCSSFFFFFEKHLHDLQRSWIKC